MPEGAGDVLLCTSLFKSLRENYPDYEFTFATNKQFHCILKNNKYIDKIIEYNLIMDDLLKMEGCDTYFGAYDICFIPHIQTQRYLTYMHNGLTKIAFNIKY